LNCDYQSSIEKNEENAPTFFILSSENGHPVYQKPGRL
jgi:hypothetical protein